MDSRASARRTGFHRARANRRFIRSFMPQDRCKCPVRLQPVFSGADYSRTLPAKVFEVSPAMSAHPAFLTNAAVFFFDPTLFSNYFSALRDTIFSVVTDNGTPFTTLGVRLFRGLAIIMIVISGVKVALGIDQ